MRDGFHRAALRPSLKVQISFLCSAVAVVVVVAAQDTYKNE